MNELLWDPLQVLKSSYNHYYASQGEDDLLAGRGKMNPGQKYCFGSPFIEVAKFQKTVFVKKGTKKIKKNTG